MKHVREGQQWGAWVVKLDGRSQSFLSNGRGHPELDRLYTPLVPNPRHYTDYSHDLIPGAIDQLVRILN